MRPSLIDELQLDATSNAVSVSALLRKALMVAAKLEVPELPKWIDKELSGYGPDDEIPSYRLIHGRVKANVWGRWISVQFPDNDVESKIAERRIDGSVADIEGLLAKEGNLCISYPSEAQRLLQEMFNRPRSEFACFIEPARLAAILDEVRNNILRWSIALDRAGVRGEGISFSNAEKEKAHTIEFRQSGGIMTIGVVGGDVSGQANTAGAAGGIDVVELRQLVGEIRDHLANLHLSAADTAEVHTALAQLDAANAADPADRGKVREGLEGVLRFVGKAGQSVLTAGLRAYTEHWMRQHGLAP